MLWHHELKVKVRLPVCYGNVMRGDEANTIAL